MPYKKFLKSSLCGMFIMLFLSWAGQASGQEKYSNDFSVDLAKLTELSPPAGTKITSENVDDYGDIIDSVLIEQIKRGDVEIEVGEPFSLDPHAAYIAATNKYGGQTKLGVEIGELLNYTAGRPFPGEPSLDDPRMGEKMAWNMRYAYGGDNGAIPEMYWYYRDMRQDKLERTLEFSASKMNFMHRVVMEPTPNVKDNSYDLQSAIHLEAYEPPDVSGTALLLFYNDDDRKVEQGWMYVPLLRRVRRVATQQKTDAFLGSDIMIEDFLGYSGRIMDMTWSYLGETYVLLPIYRHDSMEVSDKKARKYDYHLIDFHGRAACYPKITWQLRKAYIVEAQPLRKSHPISKRRFYVDAQTYGTPYGLIYDKAGELWKIGIGGVSHPDHHLAENKGSGVPLLDSSVMIDVQARHCTTIQMLTRINVKRMKVKDFHPGVLNQRGR